MRMAVIRTNFAVLIAISVAMLPANEASQRLHAERVIVVDTSIPV
ncbi:MAG: hypothetical protein WBG18_23725 [Xanthobacteraceae bacterium]